jgi:hypothetical protein
MLRLIGRLLTLTAMMYAIALQWFVNSAWFYQLGQGQGRAVAALLGETSAIQAGFAFLLCVTAALITSDPQLRINRPVGWAGLVSYGIVLHSVFVPAIW